jgi:hypothetical protein
MQLSSCRDSYRELRGLRLHVVLWILLSSVLTGALADEGQDCTAAGGSLLVGNVVSPPKFKHGAFLKGVELSHTHLVLKSGDDSKTYDVAMDNVFASGYQNNMTAVPSPLNSIQVGDKIEVCGIPFTGGIHWVHTDCGDTPTAADPNGWVKEIAVDGTTGPNLEDSQKYCYLWPHN